MHATAEAQYEGVAPRVEFRPLMRNVYLWMTGALLLTAFTAWLTSNISALNNLLDKPLIVFGAFILQLLLVGSLAVGIRKMTTAMASAVFLVYAAANGFTLSLIVLYYDAGTLTAAFVTASALFVVMSVVGILTNLDLQKYGTYLLIGLIGLLIALVINIFIGSSTFDLAMSVFAVILFSALTAYDTQKIHRLASDPSIEGQGSALMTKLSILGALSLYLDFLNLFIWLLRIFGRGR